MGKVTEVNKNNKCPADLAFLIQDVGDTCQWPGTKWTGKGNEAHVLPCGEPAVGKGAFHEPIHKMCFVADLCERHANREMEDLDKLPTEDSRIWGGLYA